jgi:hypothetical protein
MKMSTFSCYHSDGTVGMATGYYYIVDGGYHLWVELIAPFKHEPDGTIANCGVTQWSRFERMWSAYSEC